MVMHLSCSSFLVSVNLVSPAFAPAIIPALLTRESVRVDFPWSTWAMTDILRMFRFLSIIARISSTVKFTYKKKRWWKDCNTYVSQISLKKKHYFAGTPLQQGNATRASMAQKNRLKYHCSELKLLQELSGTFYLNNSYQATKIIRILKRLSKKNHINRCLWRADFHAVVQSPVNQKFSVK